MKRFFNTIAKKIIFKKYRAIVDDFDNKSLTSCSDLFFYRNDNYSTIYIQENTKALYFSKKKSFEVCIVFFDSDGKEIFRKNLLLNSFDFVVNLDKYHKNLDKYGSFFIFSNEKLEFIPHFRGYIGYKKRLDSQYNFVHGNFGALYIDSKKNIQTKLNFSNNKKFSYSPQLCLEENQTFVILNPFNFEINVEFSYLKENDLKIIETGIIKSFGIFFFKAEKNICCNDLVPVFSSNIPALRPLIFIENNYFFDVLHG